MGYIQEVMEQIAEGKKVELYLKKLKHIED